MTVVGVEEVTIGVVEDEAAGLAWVTTTGADVVGEGSIDAGAAFGATLVESDVVVVVVILVEVLEDPTED